MRAQGQMVMGGPLTSDGGAFCKGNRETQVNVTGRGLQGQEPRLSLCQAGELQPASSGLGAGLRAFGWYFLQTASLGLGWVPGRPRLLPLVILVFQQGVL